MGARFENTGVIGKDDCIALGLVGPVARASGLDRDARAEFPVRGLAPIPVATAQTGDVQARAMVRWSERALSAEKPV